MFNWLKRKKTTTVNSMGLLNLNDITLSKDIAKNIEIIKQIFQDDDTLVIREFENRENNKIKCCAIFIDGMVNNEIINDSLVKPIMLNQFISKDSDTLDIIKSKVIFINDVKTSNDMNSIIESVLYGDTALLIDGAKSVLIINTKGWKTRSITEPETDKTLRGPREGFTESMLMNLSLIRRKIMTNDLKFKYRKFGTRSNTKACICYIDSLIDKKILNELNSRLDKINIDSILDTNYISEIIKDSPFSAFKTIGTTERPDIVAAKLLEGRIAIVVDGTPNILTVPYLFIENFQSNEDYYLNYFFTSIGRIIRILAFILSISVPAVYIAITTFHEEMLPTQLALSIAAAHQGVPFPTVIECIGMLFVFEIIRETGTRMPSNIGQALSIVGALVVGQAAVEARLISAPMVIIVATTAITSLINIKIKGATIFIRFIFLILSSFYGLYGYYFGVIGLLIHILSIRSFGIDYTSQMGSYNSQALKDIYIRSPWWRMLTRPKFMATDKVRMDPYGDKS